MDLSAAIELIQRTACQAAAAQILPIDDPLQHHVLIGGEVKTIFRVPATRKHQVADLESFVRAVEDLTEGRASVWHNHQAVIGYLDDESRRDTVTLKLEQSDQFTALGNMADKPLDQRAFCSMLKSRLGVDETFIAQFRRLDWRAEQTAHGTTARGQDRMGQAISAEVNGVADLAEELVLEIPIYTLPGVRRVYRIPCQIEIDAREQRLALVPAPNAIAYAVLEAQEDLHGWLDEAINGETEHSTPIFFGTP